MTKGGDNDTAPGGDPAYTVTPEDTATHQLLSRYLQRRRQQLGELEAALKQADYELIRRIGHNLHGSGAAYGLRRVSLLGAGLERAAERQDGQAAAENLGQLRRFLASVKLNSPPG